MKKKTFSSIYAPYIREFVEFKRSLGYKYKSPERILLIFDKFTLENGNTNIGITKETTINQDWWNSLLPV